MPDCAFTHKPAISQISTALQVQQNPTHTKRNRNRKILMLTTVMSAKQAAKVPSRPPYTFKSLPLTLSLSEACPSA